MLMMSGHQQVAPVPFGQRGERGRLDLFGGAEPNREDVSFTTESATSATRCDAVSMPSVSTIIARES